MFCVIKEKELKEKEITLIAALDKNRGLGKDNELLWHIPEDLKRFKTLTSNHCVIMGRKTFESLPFVLPNRTNIVISRNAAYSAEGVKVVPNMERALEEAAEDPQPFIIGGGQIYQMAMPIADRLELTWIDATAEADTFFPEISAEEWEITETETYPMDSDRPIGFTFNTYKRK